MFRKIQWRLQYRRYVTFTKGDIVTWQEGTRLKAGQLDIHAPEDTAKYNKRDWYVRDAQDTVVYLSTKRDVLTHHASPSGSLHDLRAELKESQQIKEELQIYLAEVYRDLLALRSPSKVAFSVEDITELCKKKVAMKDRIAVWATAMLLFASRHLFGQTDSLRFYARLPAEVELISRANSAHAQYDDKVLIQRFSQLSRQSYQEKDEDELFWALRADNYSSQSPYHPRYRDLREKCWYDDTIDKRLTVDEALVGNREDPFEAREKMNHERQVYRSFKPRQCKSGAPLWQLPMYTFSDLHPHLAFSIETIKVDSKVQFKWTVHVMDLNDFLSPSDPVVRIAMDRCVDAAYYGGFRVPLFPTQLDHVMSFSSENHEGQGIVSITCLLSMSQGKTFVGQKEVHLLRHSFTEKDVIRVGQNDLDRLLPGKKSILSTKYASTSFNVGNMHQPAIATLDNIFKGASRFTAMSAIQNLIRQTNQPDFTTYLEPLSDVYNATAHWRFSNSDNVPIVDEDRYKAREESFDDANEFI